MLREKNHYDRKQLHFFAELSQFWALSTQVHQNELRQIANHVPTLIHCGQSQFDIHFCS